MNRIKTIILSSLAIAATIATFTLSIKNNSLESLRANAEEAGVKCVPASGVNCLAPNGTIFCEYKKERIGGAVLEEN